MLKPEPPINKKIALAFIFKYFCRSNSLYFANGFIASPYSCSLYFCCNPNLKYTFENYRGIEKVSFARLISVKLVEAEKVYNYTFVGKSLNDDGRVLFSELLMSVEPSCLTDISPKPKIVVEICLTA